MEFETAQGEHLILAKVGWCKSSEYSITLNDTIKSELTVDFFKSANRIVPMMFMAFGLYLIFTVANKPAIGLVLMIVPLLFLFYYWTIGRNAYLRLYSVPAESPERDSA